MKSFNRIVSTLRAETWSSSFPQFLLSV
jgi:hypothetical protein